MDRQNVTLSLSKSLLKKAKVVAAQEEKSLSELLREALEHKVHQSSRYHTARQRHMMLLRKGIDLGTKGKWRISRDALHERR